MPILFPEKKQHKPKRLYHSLKHSHYICFYEIVVVLKASIANERKQLSSAQKQHIQKFIDTFLSAPDKRKTFVVSRTFSKVLNYQEEKYSSMHGNLSAPIQGQTFTRLLRFTIPS